MNKKHKNVVKLEEKLANSAKKLWCKGKSREEIKSSIDLAINEAIEEAIFD